MFSFRRSTSVLGSVALATSLVLSGCSDDGESPEPSQSSTSATGQPGASQSAPTTASPDAQEQTSGPESSNQTADPGDESTATAGPGGDGSPQTADPGLMAAVDDSFSIELPNGWEDAAALVDFDEDMLLAIKDKEFVDGFYTNLVIVRGPYTSNLTEAVERTAEELAGDEWEYELLEPVEVDGNKGPGYTIIREQDGVRTHQTQIWVSRQGVLHLVNFSVLDSQAEQGHEILADIMASWRWAD